MITCYRIQPIGHDLHAVETVTSDDQSAGGVHVYGSIGECGGCSEWFAPEYNDGCEVAVIECDDRDLRDSGDVEGYVLRRGAGRIVSRIEFDSLRDVVEWAAENE